MIGPWFALALSFWPNTRPAPATPSVSSENGEGLIGLVRILCIYSYVILCTTADELIIFRVSLVETLFPTIPTCPTGCYVWNSTALL